MKQVIVNIPENKFSFFMKLMASLNFVKIINPEQPVQDKLTKEQNITWNNVKQGFMELQLAEEGKLKFRPIEDILHEL